jgi:hypothetical protein
MTRIFSFNFFHKELLSTLMNRDTEEKPGWCSDPHLPPCAAYSLSLSLSVSLTHTHTHFLCACV